MRILAIDPGTKCGHAWCDGPPFDVNPKFCGVWNLAPKRHEGGGMRYVRLRGYLEEMKPDRVVYEEVTRHVARGPSGKPMFLTLAAHMYGGITATIMAYCDPNEIPYIAIPVGTIKKHATGKGNANKTAMIRAAQEKFGYFGKSDDEADAMWILSCALVDFNIGAGAEATKE